MARWSGVLMLLVVGAAAAQEAADRDPARNLAFGRPVVFLPTPNYGLTAARDTDATDLTDGRLSARPDQHLWFENLAVGYSYAGRVNLAVDLGAPQPVDEVAIRFLGGSPQAGVSCPGWLEVVVADDLAGPWYRVAEYSRWHAGDAARFGVPRSAGQAFIHRFRFADLRTRARCVGLRFYATGLTCSDELYVFRGDHDAAAVTRDPATLTDFTVTSAATYFHKPAVHVARELAVPVPLGAVVTPAEQAQPFTYALTLPAGVEVKTGQVGEVALAQATTTAAPSGARTWTFSWPTKGVSTKTLGRLYLQGAPEPGQPAQVTCQTTWGDDRRPPLSVPLEVLDLPATRPPRRLLAGLSWWDLSSTLGWPDWAAAYRHLGFNTVPFMGTWFDPADPATAAQVRQVREAGFDLQMIDSTWHRMLSRHRAEPELYCQLAGGPGKQLCPSYRGRFHTAELDRVAAIVKVAQPRYVTCDIELWNWRGPVDAPHCSRCQAAKAASGLATWEEWQLAQGEALAKELHAAVQRGVREGGGPPCELGVYDFRPGLNYQFFWPFDRLYPAVFQSAQVSTYTSLEPYHLHLVGDEVRADRAKLRRGDQLPWLTPGDAGTFDGDSFCWAILECFVNGSRGVNFWSSRVWDGDLLAGYSRALRLIGPVEDLVIDGAPDLPPVDGPGRVSGARLGDQAVLLVADYFGDAGGTVKVRLDLPAAAVAVDLATGQEVARLAAGASVWAVPLAGQRARLLHLRPAGG